MEGVLGKFLEKLHSGQKDEVCRMLYTTRDTVPLLLDYAQNNDCFLLHEVCRHDYPDIIHLLIQDGANCEEHNRQNLTPLQVAAQHGCAGVVTFLLQSEGCDLEKYSLLSDTSPHYLATMNGHLEVVEKLNLFAQSNCPNLKESLSSCTVESVLFNAACLSGKLEMVNLWYTPELDVNCPLPFVTDLTNCENLTPLNAACTANSLEVVEYLMGKGANITEAMTDNYPELIGTVLNKKTDTTGKSIHMDVFDTPYLHLHKIHSSWLKPHLAYLSKVDVSNNSLKELPCCLPWETPLLKTLNASKNKIQMFPTPPKNWSSDKSILSELNISHNKLSEVPPVVFQLQSLQKLYLQGNSILYLYRSNNTDTELMTPAERMKHFKTSNRNNSSTKWDCVNLTELNVSSNGLELLSDELLQSCSSLTTLTASNNNLFKFPTPWACQLKNLDLSKNKIAIVPTTLSQFWSKTLLTLNVSHNHLREVSESIVTLYALECLDVSHNAISRLPPPAVWSCENLQELNLGYNKLTCNVTTVEHRKNFFFRQSASSYDLEEEEAGIEFPEILGEHLLYLHLNNNNINSVPASVCNLHLLKWLSFEDNPMLSGLPKELARLSSCKSINLDGCSSLQHCVPAHYITECRQNAEGLLAHLRMQLRDCEPCNRLKVMVIGEERRGKTSVVNCLTGNTDNPVSLHTQISISHWNYCPNSNRRKRKEKCSEIRFSIWDLPGYNQLVDIHQCFFTNNTLYLLVWDVSMGETGVEQLAKWLDNIQSRAPDSTTILVGTHLDKLPKDEGLREEMVKRLTLSIREKYYRKHYPKLGPISYVSCCIGAVNRITELQDVIYNTALDLQDHDGRRFMTNRFIGRQIPKSYLELERLLKVEAERRIQQKEPPVLVQQEFDKILEQVPNNDIDSDTEKILAAKYLHDLGEVLHFNDQLRGLNSLYFLDAEWLCDLLSQIIVHKKSTGFIKNGIILMENLKQLFDPLKFPQEFFSQYIQLLERFEIALVLDVEKLLIPCKVSKEKFGSVGVSHNLGEKIYRFYRLPSLPSGFWGRLITKVLVSLHRFTGPKWSVNRSESYDRKRTLGHKKSFNQPICRTNSQGFMIKRVEPIYWREGIKVSYEGGQFMVESVKWKNPESQMSSMLNTGILITVLSSIQDFSALGFLIDEIDNLIEEWYTGIDEGVQIALCPVCCQKNPDLIYQPETLAELTHFTVTLCAGVCVTRPTFTCPVTQQVVPLKKLVPELMLTDLPNKLHLDGEKLKVSVEKEKPLGEGAFGAVYFGFYNNEKVAVKLFPYGLEKCIRQENNEIITFDRLSSSEESGMGSQSSSSFRTSSSSQVSHESAEQTEERRLESLGLKVLYSLCEMRKEVALLSRLNHPCVVSLVGVCLASTCLVLEIAPLGNLREVIDQHMDPDLHTNVLSQIKDRVFGTVFSRKLTFNIVFQVVKALQYLHVNNVIYRDLKPGNILVWSLDVSDTVNVKLSDYGISKFSTPQGLIGNCGSIGYQAPEVTVGVAYDEKVDIFSLGIVMYEILSGVLPYNKSSVSSQITRKVREGYRPQLQGKDFTVDTKMCNLEKMMVQCWETDHVDRPNANTIVNVMNEAQFLCLQRVVDGPPSHDHRDIDCIMTYTSEGSHSHIAWIWEGRGIFRYYHIFDIDRGQYVVSKQRSPGPTVNCMTKVNEFIWMGNQASMIEVFGHKGPGVPLCLGKLEVPSPPTALLYHRVPDPQQQLLCKHPRASQEFVEYVYCGLNDGKLLVFSAVADNPLLRKRDPPELRWSVFRDINLSEGRSVHKLILVNNHLELWASSGNAIYVISVTTLQISCKISLDISGTGWTQQSDVVDMVCGTNRVWCCCNNETTVLEIDSVSHQPISMISCFNLCIGDRISAPLTIANENTDGFTSMSVSKDCKHNSCVSKKIPDKSEGVHAKSEKETDKSKETTSKSENTAAKSKEKTFKPEEITATSAEIIDIAKEIIVKPQGVSDKFDQTKVKPGKLLTETLNITADLRDSATIPSGSGKVNSYHEKLSAGSEQIIQTTTELTGMFECPPPLPAKLSKAAQSLKDGTRCEVDNVRYTEKNLFPPKKVLSGQSPPPLPSRDSKPTNSSWAPPPIPSRTTPHSRSGARTSLNTAHSPPPVPSRESKPSLFNTSLENSAEKSRTLPNKSTRSKLRHDQLSEQKSRSLNEDNSFLRSVFVGSGQLRLMIVQDTLWIGQQTGDIALVSLASDINHGKVLSVMSNDIQATYLGHVTHLLKTECNSIISVNKLSPEHSVMFIWEAWSSGEVAEFSGYSASLRKEERIRKNKSV